MVNHTPHPTIHLTHRIDTHIPTHFLFALFHFFFTFL